MPRYKLTIEYDGGPFVGWQRQENGRSVQQAIEEAVLAFSRRTVVVKGAGRTDAGVHALGQVAHLDLRATGRPIRFAMPSMLTSDPSRWQSWRPSGSPRISTRASRRGKRHYLYRICDRRAPPALDIGRLWAVDVAARRRAHA